MEAEVIHLTEGGGTQHGKAIKVRGTNVPAEQSVCEVKAIKTKAAHPNMDMFEFARRYGMFDIFGTEQLSPAPHEPFTYRDTESGVTFYVESDGRHVMAVDSDGKLLWVRNPFVESNMCPYRSAHPFIVALTTAQPASLDTDVQAGIRKEIDRQLNQMSGERTHPQEGDRFISLTFNSSNFGWVNIRTGDYYDQGQN
jgi:hypothetical protein